MLQILNLRSLYNYILSYLEEGVPSSNMRNLFRNISKIENQNHWENHTYFTLLLLNLRDSHLPSGQIFEPSGLDNFD